jgi:preprotein translocase subunit SecA
MSSTRTTLFDSYDATRGTSLVDIERAGGLGQDTAVPSGVWRNVTYGPPRIRTPKNADAVWDWAVGLINSTVPRTRLYLRRAERVLAMESQFAAMSDGQLRNECGHYRGVFRRGRFKRSDVERAFAVVRECAWRVLRMKPYREQVASALAMHDGHVSEQATGEGKTLTATMPATLAGWRGRGCHVITVNDYLAQRDAQIMGPLYEFCGLTVASINQDMFPTQRRVAYQADITYLTNKEAAADFLRDGLSQGPQRSLQMALANQYLGGNGNGAGLSIGGGGADHVVMRGLEYAIVDEADSVLIDEAVTPLIISGEAPNDELNRSIMTACELAPKLVRGEDYAIDQRFREVNFTRKGKQKLAALTVNIGGVFAGARRREELVNQAVCARELYLNGRQYVVVEGKVNIVDEFTGRIMPDRSWRDGLHQAVEAKEGLEITPPKDTLARISFQRFFRLYNRLCGMTGTAAESRGELWAVYRRQVVRIPTHKTCIRERRPDRIYAREDAKWDAIAEEIRRVHATGQPILVGTRSVVSSEKLSERLTQMGLPHEVLNAIRHKEEAKIVSQAGTHSRITVATNMAGRGTDIKLDPGVAQLGGLRVIACECHESTRIDRQLFGRAGRQGDPGTAGMYVSFEDEVLLRYASSYTRKLLASFRTRDKAEITSPFTRALLWYVRARAGRIALAQRKAVLRTDDWLAEHMGFTGEGG